MRKLLRGGFFFLVLLISLKGISQQVIQATLKLNSNPNEVEVWLRPGFSNSTEYLAQLAIPIAWPSGPPAVQPGNITVTLDPTFGYNFGLNYAVNPYPLAHNICNTENYRVITLIRTGGGASNPQTWTQGQEFKLLTVTFPSGTPNGKVKIADYPDGGSDGQGYYYTADGNANYYISATSSNNFYAATGQSTVGNMGCAGSGFVETNVIIPVACAIPTVSITNVTNTSADITWASIGGASGYEYAISTSSTPPVSGTPTMSSSFSPPGLNASTLYYVYVRTNCGSGNFSNWSSTNFTTAAAACIAPTTPTVSNVQITTADINWNAVSGATGYEYFLSTSSTAPPTAPGTGTGTTGTTYNATGLIGGTTYYIYVRTDCVSGDYSPWVSASFTTLPPLCAPTLPPTVNSITTTSADISWNAVSGSSGYEYVISTGSGAPVGPGTAISSTIFSATTLIPGTTYYVFIRNNCGGGLYSGWSNTNFNTLCPKPGSVTAPAATITSTSVIITWNSTGATSYQYDISTSSTPTTLTPSTGGTTTTGTSHNETGLTSGTTYYAHIRSICASGSFSEWQTISFSTICTVPGAITIPLAQLTPTSANINWGVVADADGYEYLLSTNPGIPVAGLGTIFTGITPSNLSPGTKYYVFVRTKCSPGVYSDWIFGSFTTPFPPCFPPTTLNVTVLYNKADISWSQVIGALGYEYKVTTINAPPAEGDTTTLRNLQLKDLLSNTQYYVYVRAKCSAGNLSDWVRQSFKTDCFKPVFSFINNGQDPGSCDLGWYKIKDAIKYEYAILTTIVPPVGSQSFTTDTTIHATNLVPGNKYYLHVRAYCSASSISEWSSREFITTGIHISPNPVSSIATITIVGDDIDNEIALFDGVGKLLTRIKLIGGRGNLNMGGYSKGIYYLRLSNERKYIKRIIKL